MIVKLLTEHHLEFLSLKEAAEAHLSLHMSKCHLVGNLIHWLNYKIDLKGHIRNSHKIKIKSHYQLFSGQLASGQKVYDMIRPCMHI